MQHAAVKKDVVGAFCMRTAGSARCEVRADIDSGFAKLVCPFPGSPISSL